MIAIKKPSCLAALFFGIGAGVVPLRQALCEDPVAGASASVENSIEAGESEADVPTRQFVKWNEYRGPISSVQVGGGFLYDFAAFAKDKESSAQVGGLPTRGDIRDARLLVKGRFRLKRKVTWTSGIMYDKPTERWILRETGIMVEVPEIYSNFFVGRTKEGFSLNKVMVGYAGWTMERATISDASVPILADGVKWLGYIPNYHLLWNVGYYGDAVSQNETFSTYQNQYVTRIAWLPILPESGNTVLHLGVNARYGKVNDDMLRLRSRPEVFPAPYFVDTKGIPTDHTRMIGWEAYYRPGPWLFGTEYWFVAVASPETRNPVFQGGDIVASWIITGETRAYNTVGGFFKEISPTRSVFKGGSGAWELVLRQSYIDLNSGTISGGKFWRLTPMVSWYLSDHLRWELAYGYGVLDRFGLQGTTHFFQSRIQIWLF